MENTSAFSMPDSISGANGAIKLNPNMKDSSGGATGTNPRGTTKTSNNCQC
jgi:hypothetical protein